MGEILRSALSEDGTGKGLGLPLPPSREPLYRASPPNSFISRYHYLLKAMGGFSAKARIGEASNDIFASLEEQATQNAWWDSLRLPRTWMSEHSMVSLHVWILNQRFKVDYNIRGWDFNGRRMAEEVFNRLWEDTTLRVRNAGVTEISVNKQLESVQRVTFDDFSGYDEALRSVESDDGMELAAAVWKGVFREDAGADTEAVLRLSDYVRREIVSVLQQPREDVYRGWITWGNAEGETGEERLARQRRMLTGEWRDALAPTGRVFFYHTTTHERRWDPPEAGFYPRRRFALQRYIDANPAALPLLPPLPSPNNSNPVTSTPFLPSRQKKKT